MVAWDEGLWIGKGHEVTDVLRNVLKMRNEDEEYSEEIEMF